MKIALVHDYLKEYGGAERVLEALHEIWPQAPIYTAFFVRNSAAGKAFSKARVVESRFAPLIKHGNLHSPLRFLAPCIWKSFDFSGYDLVITSSSWYITRGFKVGPKTKVICYCHTPPRYLYGYQTSVEWQRYKIIKAYALVVNHFLRMFDFESAQKVDHFIANSKNVQARIKKFYRRDSTVIYPPVNVEEIVKATKKLKPENYYLVASRLVGGKGIELAIKAAQKLKFPLKIIGEKTGLKWLGRDFGSFESKYVEFLGRLPDKELYQYYGRCRAFLALAKDEDFGIAPVEAMTAGRPVIAFRGGGYLESIVEKKTGIFFDEPTVDGLVKAIKHFNDIYYCSIKAEDCRRQAKKFSKKRFKREITDFVNAKIEQHARTSRS